MSAVDQHQEELTAAFMAGCARGRDGRQAEIDALKADLREAYVEAAFWLKQVMDANENEVDLAQKARFEELRLLSHGEEP